jgi:hypothetical protein
MHRKVIDGKCRILDINEMIMYPKPDLLTAEEAALQVPKPSPEIKAQQKERLDELERVRNSRNGAVHDGMKYVIPPMIDMAA